MFIVRSVRSIGCRVGPVARVLAHETRGGCSRPRSDLRTLSKWDVCFNLSGLNQGQLLIDGRVGTWV